MGDAPASRPGQTPLRIVAYNIKHGRGMDDAVDLRRIAAVLRRLDADVIALQEVDKGTARTAGVDQVEALARLLGYTGFHGAHRRYQGGDYGNAILTRLPVLGVRTHPIPAASGSALTVHEVEVVWSPAEAPGRGAGQRISVVSVHLAGSPDQRLAQADSLNRLFEGREHPVVLAGDFNGRPEGPVVRNLRRRWSVLAKSGEPETYPSPAPDREIDFVMVRRGSGLEVIEHRVIAEPMASDHRPLLAVLKPGRPGSDVVLPGEIAARVCDLDAERFASG